MCDRPQFFLRLFQCRFHRFQLADIHRNPERAATEFLCHVSSDTADIASDIPERDIASFASQALSTRQPNATRPTRHDSNMPVKFQFHPSNLLRCYSRFINRH